MSIDRRPTATDRARLRARLARAKPACHICGGSIAYDLPTPHPDSFELDHIIPLNRGGTHTIENAAASHRRCNRAKSDKDHAPIVRRSDSLA